jgi:hypothetical protein
MCFVQYVGKLYPDPVGSTYTGYKEKENEVPASMENKKTKVLEEK